MKEIRLSEYSDSLLYRCLIWFVKNERHCGSSRGARQQRRALLQMIISAATFREDLPDPVTFFKDRRLSRGVYTAEDMRSFVMLVHDRMETLRDPGRLQTQDEYTADMDEWRKEFGGSNSEIENTRSNAIKSPTRKKVRKTQKIRPSLACNVIRT